MATNLVTPLFFGMMSGDDAPQHPSPAPSLPGANRFVPHPLEKISEFGRALGCYRKAAHKLNPRFFPLSGKKPWIITICGKPSVPPTSPGKRSWGGVESYRMQWPKLLLIPLSPWPSLITQESPLEKLKGGKSHKNNAQAGKFILLVKTQCWMILQAASCYLDILI